ncbi:MAG: IS200/IS605 family transposase [Thermoproteota archaeon]
MEYYINKSILFLALPAKPVMNDESFEKLIAETKGFKILEMRVMPDHIHLFIEANPFDSPMNIVKIFKGITGLRMFKKFPELQKQLWRGVLWSPSYYIGTAGHVSADTIEKYIREQERHSSSG